MFLYIKKCPKNCCKTFSPPDYHNYTLGCLMPSLFEFIQACAGWHKLFWCSNQPITKNLNLLHLSNGINNCQTKGIDTKLRYSVWWYTDAIFYMPKLSGIERYWKRITISCILLSIFWWNAAKSSISLNIMQI